MEIKEIVNKKIWQSFFDKCQLPSFLQSWEWGEFQKKGGNEILRVGFYYKKNLVAIALVIKSRSSRGNFLFVPHGPLTIRNTLSVIKKLLNYLWEIAKRESFSFIRILPLLERNDKNQKIFQTLKLRKSPIYYMHSERIWALPLTDAVGQRAVGEDQILAGMRKTTRYLIRKAQKEGVVIKKRIDKKAIDNFMKIYMVTADRENFVPFSKKAIADEFESFNQTGNALFFEALHPEGVLASALIIFTKSTAFYHHGASIHSKIPATYLLQWEAIKEAKNRGCKIYDFQGIFEQGRTPKSWQGLTLFKTGFGGKQIDYLPTQDYIISPKYFLTYLYEKFLAWRRGV